MRKLTSLFLLPFPLDRFSPSLLLVRDLTGEAFETFPALLEAKRKKEKRTNKKSVHHEREAAIPGPSNLGEFHFE